MPSIHKKNKNINWSSIFVLNLVISGMPSILPMAQSQIKRELHILNLVISGMPSIHLIFQIQSVLQLYFKPCYKWNAFNTSLEEVVYMSFASCFKPCYKWNAFNTKKLSIFCRFKSCSFKPCYKWNAFNTEVGYLRHISNCDRVLNLVISGMPSIRIKRRKL